MYDLDDFAFEISMLDISSDSEESFESEDSTLSNEDPELLDYLSKSFERELTSSFIKETKKLEKWWVRHDSPDHMFTHAIDFGFQEDDSDDVFRVGRKKKRKRPEKRETHKSAQDQKKKKSLELKKEMLSGQFSNYWSSSGYLADEIDEEKTEQQPELEPQTLTSSTSPSEIVKNTKAYFDYNELENIVLVFRNFIDDKTAVLKLPDTIRTIRTKVSLRQIQIIAEAFAVRVGSKDKFSTVVLYKTRGSKTPSSGELDMLVESALSIVKKANKYKVYSTPDTTGSPSKHRKTRKARKSPKKKEYTVAEAAPPVSESNVGFGMLVKMGWSGGGLGGTSQGITEPVEAIVRKKRKGLGQL